MLEIKIVFKTGQAGLYTKSTENESPKEIAAALREMIGTVKQKDLRGSVELTELNTGYETVIDLEEILTLGTRIIEGEDK